MAASDSFVASCEGDILCTVSMMILQYLSGQTVAYGDAIHHWDNILKLSPCGFMPFSLASSKPSVRNFMEGVGFTGIQTTCTMKPGRVTILRLIEDVGQYRLLCTTGEGLSSTRPRQGCMPALDIRLDCDIGELVKHYAGQHFAVCAGDLSEEVERLAGMLGVGFVRL